MLRRERRDSEASLHRPVLPETTWLAIICVLDTILTVYLVNRGLAVESNPILSWTFDYGAVVFVATKYLSFVPALVAIEMLRPRLGEFARSALRFGIFAYLASYVIGSLLVHAG